MNKLPFDLIIILSAAIIIGLVIRFGLLRASLSKRIKSDSQLEELLNSLTAPIMLAAITIGLRIGVIYTEAGSILTPPTHTAISILVVITAAIFFFRLSNLIELLLKKSLSKSKKQMDEMLAPVARKTIQIIIIVIAILMIAQNLSGKTMASILTGLGVGGLAIALAAQETIKNFFGSIVICSDKPFELNERIIVDGVDGNVESVGFRSTRIRTLSGHLVTVPNGELANKSIENVTRRPHIKQLMKIGVTYDTPPEKMELALQIIKDLLDNHEGMNENFPPRVAFDEFGACSLNILVIYWYHPADFWAFKAFNEKFNLELLKRFNAEGIDFAFPTQTLYLAGDEKRPLNIHSLKDT